MERLSEKMAWAIEECVNAWSQVEEEAIKNGIDRLAAYEDTGLEPKTIAAVIDPEVAALARGLRRILSADQRIDLEAWIKADKEGRLVVLPCKVGDTVYGCFPRYCRKAIECKVVKIRACQFSDGSIHHIVDVEFYIANPYYDDGRLMLHGHQAVVADCYGNWDRVFLSREEAEAALNKEGEHG